MYDVKYAPFADSYIGMANGDVYEHVKRWLQQRLRFVDTLYDYAPSYNNDVLTIRANTTEPMTLYIETYTPVYQHLSWYNNQMDKKKIDGKIAVEFTGTAMAATDQEVLIYGGSNIKSIKGIQSMNPNRMLIGAATKLTELDASNCQLLADVNANKANFAPHAYLNKLNISGCPLLGGNLIVSNSPLLQEIDIRGTAITGLNLPSNLRNLKVLKLPAAIPNLTLNDAGQLHTLIFEDGVKLQNVSMTNCNALVNVENFDIRSASSVILNNSYSSVQELYFRDTTNVSLSNMPNLERVIYTPNAEYETFDKSNVDNASDYKVSVFNSPKCNTFMVTAPYRESYMKDYGEVKPDEVFIANSIDISGTRFTDVKLLATTDTNVLKLPSTTKNIIVDSAYDLDTEYLTDGDYDTIHTDLYEPYNTDYENTVQLDGNTPNIIPSASDGSLIFTMYAPANATEPTSGTWDMNGLELEKIHAFGLNNDIIQDDNDNVSMPNRYDGYSNTITNLILPNMVAEYTASDTITSPTFNAEFKYTSIISKQDNVYKYFIYAEDPNNLPTSISFTDKTTLLTVEYLNVSNVTDMTNMFRNCSSLTSLDASNWDTSNVKDMTSMFQNCKSLTSLDLSNFDTSNVRNMNAMFYNCTILTSLDISNFDTSKVRDMALMFTSCNALTYLDVSNFDTTNVTTMANMFQNCKSLTSLDLSNFDTSNVTKMSNMFYNCSALTSLDVSNFNTSKVTNMASMFQNCSALKTLTANNMTHANSELFAAAINNGIIIELIAKNWKFNGENVSLYNSFKTNTTLQKLDLSDWNNSNVMSMSNMFKGCTSLTSLDLSNFNTSNVTNMTYMFSDCTSLTSLDLSSFSTSNATITTYMFSGCSALTSLDVSNWDTSNVTSMVNMFAGCRSLTSLDVSNWDTSNVTSMNFMFNGCHSLTSLDVSNWDTSNVTSMVNMFAGCKLPTSIDVSGFNTSKVTTMASMFYNCNALTSLDVSSFDTSKVTNMSAMFNGCSALTSLDVAGWPLNDYTQTAILTLPVGDDATNEIHATVSFTVPSGWSLINSASMTMTLRQTDLDNLTDEEIAALVDEGWTIG